MIPENARRKRLAIQNIGANPVYIAYGETALSSKGIYLAPTNGTMTDEPDPTGYIFQGNVYGISTAANVVIWQEE